MYFLKQYGKDKVPAIALFFLFAGITTGIFLLEHIPLVGIVYPLILCTAVGLFCLAYDGYRTYVTYRELQKLSGQTVELLAEQSFPHTRTFLESQYQQMLRTVAAREIRHHSHMNARYQDMMDYYTVWAHQIKTPIAAMSLHLQESDTKETRVLREELSRIEQYVDMVLAFLRLDSEHSDYLFREYQLDEIIKPALRKFSLSFIHRKLQLLYEPLQQTIITDQKWLLFVIEQILSNALKYTSQGSVHIYMEPDCTLCIRDTGMGIAPSDLPRIFEKGYTGYNGRTDKKASGLGLYLCRQICHNLNADITAESVLNEGTTIRICFGTQTQVIE